MDEKHAPMPPPIRRGFSPLRLLLVLGYLALAATTYWYFHPQAALPSLSPVNPPNPQHAATARLVPLEAHIMSKCPDAKVGRTSHPPLPWQRLGNR